MNPFTKLGYFQLFPWKKWIIQFQNFLNAEKYCSTLFKILTKRTLRWKTVESFCRCHQTKKLDFIHRIFLSTKETNFHPKREQIVLDKDSKKGENIYPNNRLHPRNIAMKMNGSHHHHNLPGIVYFIFFDSQKVKRNINNGFYHFEIPSEEHGIIFRFIYLDR